MRLGLLGGTFDPIHLGHLRAAENAREALGLDRVVFMPAGQSRPTASPRGRRPWTATRWWRWPPPGIRASVPSDVELRRDGPSYTVDTVAAPAGHGPGGRRSS